MDNIKDNQIKDDKYLSLKVQKLTQAVYLVTSLISDNEPIKWHLREESLDILTDMAFNHDQHISPLYKVSGLESVLVKISRLLSFLEVSLSAGFVSEMNLLLLKKEYLNLKQILEEKLKENNVSHFLGNLTDSFDPGHPVLESKNLVTKDSKSSEYLKINRLPHKSRDLAKNSRRSIILDFLKGKDWTSIKDITEAVAGCSAKTIQRELADLVQKGILKKKGDRRWSRYLLA